MKTSLQPIWRLIAWALLLVGCARPLLPPPVLDPTLILVSCDGFRWDYLETADTPTLDRLAGEGVRAEGLIPVFPSKTFPSHYSLVTGLHPGHHGIVSNNMLDRETGLVFSLGDREQVENPLWWGGEPIWVTAERQGLTAATLFWPGSETEVAGDRPTYWYRYDSRMGFEERVDRVLAWLDLPDGERPHLITLYLDEPNESGHRFGPDAPETRAAVERVDRVLGRLVKGLEKRGIRNRIDLVVVSDHGMAAVGPERVILLDEHVELEEGELFEQGALLQIYPHPGREEEILASLKDAHPHLTVWHRDEIPERFYLAGSPRIAPIVGAPDPGWEVFSAAAFARIGEGMLKGDHGQDPADPRMHGLFVAGGPSLAQGLRTGRFSSVEVYNLLAAALEIEPAPNDGDASVAASLLRR